VVAIMPQWVGSRKARWPRRSRSRRCGSRR
jgi:hypothetical protein